MEDRGSRSSILHTLSIAGSKFTYAVEHPFQHDLNQLLSNGGWALKFIWSTDASLAVGLVMSTIARGMVPAGLAVFARWSDQCIYRGKRCGRVGMDAVLPWFFLGFGVTILEAIAPLGTKILRPAIA